MSIQKQRINKQISSSEVRLIDKDGNNVGIVPTTEALEKAKEDNLDLVEVSANAKPPVCKILDYAKYKYDQKAKFKKSKTKNKKTTLKELYIGPNIGDGDLRLRIDRGKGFLENGNVVKYGVKFKGRQMAYPELGEKKLKIIQSELSEVSNVEQEPKMVGRMMLMVLAPKGK